MFKKYLKEIKLIESISHSKTPIMGFCALWIFFYHFYIPIGQTAMSYDPVNTGNIFYDIFMRFLGSADLGVDIFLIISGISVMYSLSKNSLKTFYIHRLKRIVPAFVISCVLIMVLQRLDFEQFLFFLFGLYNFTFDILFFSWYFWCALILYLVSPLIYKLYQKINKDLLTVTLMLIIYIVVIYSLFPIYRPLNIYYFLSRVPAFIIGTFLGIKLIKKEDVKLSETSQVIIIVITIMWLAAYASKWPYTSNLVLTTPMYTDYTILALLLSIVLSIFFKSAHRIIDAVLNFCGTNSYEIYIYSMSVNQIVYWGLSKRDNVRHYFYLYLIATLLLSHLSNYIFNVKYRQRYAIRQLSQKDDLNF